jgi:hypothetical protein|tara:strand:- start:978 stop:1139 length:162 start_codon:yes stop_codon:yes gene_type:complete
MNWLIERLKEPSSYAALAVGCIIVAMVTQVEWIAWVGILGAVAGFILKEKEIF